MSKNYHMVQYVFPPNTMPLNTALRKVIYDAAEKYIKEGKLAMGGSRGGYDPTRKDKAWCDYRDSHLSNRFTVDENGVLNTLKMWGNQPQVFYRIFLDLDAANEFIDLVNQYGALVARIITEEQATNNLVDGHIIPAGVFVPEERVAQYVWPGHPNFVYNGTYPTPGAPDATPFPEA